jgi:coproporphyrinogen III oxidase-like Fe-S oxidoreductase
MLAQIVSYITRREGRKFLKLNDPVDLDEVVGRGSGNDREVSLYVHIPFCRTLCPFCCFNRYLLNEDKARRYFQSLKRELALYMERGYRFSDFYFGGGTPTVMMDELQSFIDHLRGCFDVRRISLETTAREINPQNVALLKQAGINRLSIGVQSFDDAVLKSMGRAFLSGAELKEKALMAEGNFDTLNVDFVFNFPGQSLEQFAADIAAFKKLGIDQATFYPLMASPHKKDAMERRFNRVDFSRERAFYEIILRELYDGGYQASTAWCFSRGERMIDEYIIDYDDYIGIGAGSVSILRGNFFVNSFALERYGELADAGRLPIIVWRRLAERENLRYYLLTKLFGGEMDTPRFRERFSSSADGKLWRELLFLRLFGLVEGRDRLRVTRNGMYPVSVMMRDFFASLNGLREYCIEQQI